MTEIIQYYSVSVGASSVYLLLFLNLLQCPSLLSLVNVIIEKFIFKDVWVRLDRVQTE